MDVPMMKSPSIVDFSNNLLISASRKTCLIERVGISRRVAPRYGAEPLTSSTRRSAEGWMSEDWAAVAKTINERVNELGWLQRELAKRSNVSQAVVREIQHHVIERR